MNYYSNEKEEVLLHFKSGEEGLSSEEAAKRLEETGRNRLKEGEKITIMQRFLAQMKDPMILILVAAAMISGVTAW